MKTPNKQLHEQWDALEALCYRLKFTEETLIWHSETSVNLSESAMYGLALTVENFREEIEKAMNGIWGVCCELSKVEAGQDVAGHG